MASDDTAKLVVALEAKFDKFQKDMERSNQIAASGVSAIEANFARLNPAIAKLEAGALSVGNAAKGIGTSFLGAAGVAGLGVAGLLTTIVNINSELAKLPALARLANTSTDRLQEVRFAGALKGVGDDSLATSIANSMQLLDEAQRQVNTLSRLFNANNLSIRSQNGELLNFDQLLEVAAKLMVNARSETERFKIAEMLGLTRDWVAVLRKGPDAFKEMAAGARDAGAVLDKDLLAKAKEFDESWTRAVVQFKAGLASGFAELVSWLQSPAVASVLAQITSAANSLVAFWKSLDTSKPLQVKVTPDAGKGVAASSLAGADTSKTPTGSETVIPKDKQKNPFDSALFAANKRVAEIDAETRSLGLNSEARERAKLVAELEEAAIKANTDAGYQNATVTDVQRKKIEALADAFEAAAKRQRESHAALIQFAVDGMDGFKQFDSFALGTLNHLEGGLVSATTRTKDFKAAVSDMSKSVIADLEKIILRMTLTAPLAEAIGSGVKGSGGLGSLFGLFGTSVANGASAAVGPGGVPMLADGGTIQPGGLAYVGEHGPNPRLIRAGAQPITVTPGDVRGGGGGDFNFNVTQHVDASGADPASVTRALAGLAALNSTLEARAVSAMQNHQRRRQ